MNLYHPLNSTAFSNVLRRLVILVGSYFVLVVPCNAQSSADEVVRITVNAVINTLQDTTLDSGAKKEKVATVVSKHFDFKAMTSRVLATNWKRASTADQQQITRLFRQMLIDTYWQKMVGFSGETVEFLVQQARDPDHVSCKTLLHTKTARIPVDYKLYRVGDTWMAYDVVIEQVSLVRNYRGKFQSIVRDSGIAGLIAHLQDETTS